MGQCFSHHVLITPAYIGGSRACHYIALKYIMRKLLLQPWTVAHQAPLSMGFPRQKYWSGLHFLLQGIFPFQGSKLHFLQRNWILYQSFYPSDYIKEKVSGWYYSAVF